MWTMLGQWPHMSGRDVHTYAWSPFAPSEGSDDDPLGWAHFKEIVLVKTIHYHDGRGDVHNLVDASTGNMPQGSKYLSNADEVLRLGYERAMRTWPTTYRLKAVSCPCHQGEHQRLAERGAAYDPEAAPGLLEG